MVAWLISRLDAAEERLQGLPPWPWRASEEHDEVRAADGVAVAEGFALSSRQIRATVDHIVLWEPGAVMERIMVERRIVAEHPVGGVGYCTNCWAHRQVQSGQAPCPTLRLLVELHAGEPGFVQEWRLPRVGG